MNDIIKKYNITSIKDANIKRLPHLDIVDATQQGKQAIVTVIPSDEVVKISFPKYPKLVNQVYNQMINWILSRLDYLEENANHTHWNCYMGGTIPENTSITYFEVPVTIENYFSEIITQYWHSYKRGFQPGNNQNFINMLLTHKDTVLNTQH